MAPGVGNPGSVLPGMLRFRWIRWIRFRVPRGPKIEYSTMILAHFAGKWGPILRQTFKTHKENRCFWLQPSKKLRKINVFRSGAHGDPLGDPWGPWGTPGEAHGPHGPPQGVPIGPHGALGPPQGYIHKLPINRLNGGRMLMLLCQMLLVWEVA